LGLRGSSLEDGLKIAEKLRKNIETHTIVEEDKTYKLTISLGVAPFEPHDSEKSLIKRADAGLYKAKQAGRNRV